MNKQEERKAPDLAKTMTDDFDRFFEMFGFGPRFVLKPEPDFVPDMEVVEKDGQLLVRADLPGLKPEDVRVDVADGMLTLQGERKQEKEERREGFYRSERNYGMFYRALPLPEGVNADNVKATFKNGVLEVAVPLPMKPEVAKGRKIEIKPE
jgi:HSP20 family protein